MKVSIPVITPETEERPKKFVEMMKKIFFAAAALFLLAGCASLPPEEELRLTRERLDRYLRSGDIRTQCEMTAVSAEMLELACRERDMIEYRIANRPGYEKIEKQFMADRTRREKELEEEARRPCEYAGGSMEPMVRNLRMTALVQTHIDELKAKWLAEP